MKRLSVVVAGTGQIKDIQIEPGTAVRDVLQQLGLREYLLKVRSDAVLRQFYRKLLGYAIGRELRITDEPLLSDLEQRLAKSGYRSSVAIQMIVQSRQFREIRGRDYDVDKAQ